MKRKKRSLGEALRALVCVQVALCLVVGGIPARAIAETAGGKQPIELAGEGAGIEELGGADGSDAAQGDGQDNEVAELGDAPKDGATTLGRDGKDAIRPVEEIESLDEADELAIADADDDGQSADLLPDDEVLPEAQSVAIDTKSVVSMGFSHSEVIDAKGTLWYWGSYWSSLGPGATYKPTRVDDNVMSISVGEEHQAFIKNDGSLWMWGGNSSGQLGDGTTTSRSKAVKVMDDVAAVSLGSGYSAAIKKTALSGRGESTITASSATAPPASVGARPSR